MKGREVRLFLLNNIDDLPESFHPTLKLKSKLLLNFSRVLPFYLFSRALATLTCALFLLLGKDIVIAINETNVVRRLIELICFPMILMIFKPRREWPDFYYSEFSTIKNQI